MFVAAIYSLFPAQFAYSSCRMPTMKSVVISAVAAALVLSTASSGPAEDISAIKNMLTKIFKKHRSEMQVSEEDLDGAATLVYMYVCVYLL